MTQLGKALRLRRLAGRNGNVVMIPMDHGASVGPIPGVVDLADTVARVQAGGATAVVMQKGLVRHTAPVLSQAGLLVHLSVSTSLNPDPNDKRIVGTVEECVRLGADGVSVHVNVGAAEESRMIEDLGRIATDCERFGMPLLAMMYPRGKDIRDPHDVELVKQVARLGAEIGADLVKCPYTGSVDSFREVVRGCPQPVLIAGGPRMESPEAVLRMIADSVEAGGRGVSLGRNVWQHADPEAMTRAIAEIVLGGASVEDALTYLKA